MNGPGLSAAVAARLRSQVPSRTVYEGAVPDGAIPARYLLVVTSEGDEAATRACDVVNVQIPYVWVYSVSRNASPDLAARECAWAAAAVRAALRNWQPTEWRLRHLVSAPPGRNDTTPDTTFDAVDQYRVRSYV